LAFFANYDDNVNDKFLERFSSEVKAPESNSFIEAMLRNLKMYSMLIDTYITNPVEKSKLFNAIEQFEFIKKKADWAIFWINDDKSSFAERLVAFAAVDEMVCPSRFASICWRKSRGIMPGLAESNELISRGEGLHRDFVCLLVRKHLKNRPTEEGVYKIIRDAVAIEKEFLVDALPVKLMGMNSDQMCEHVAEKLLEGLGFADEKKFDTAEMKRKRYEFRLNIDV